MRAIPAKLKVTSKGNAVGFTVDGSTVTIGPRKSHPCRVFEVVLYDRELSLPMQHTKQTFTTLADAQRRAADLIDHAKTVELAWWPTAGMFA